MTIEHTFLGKSKINRIRGKAAVTQGILEDEERDD